MEHFATLCVCFCHQVGERVACCSEGGKIYKHINVVLQFLPLKSLASFDPPPPPKKERKTEKTCLSDSPSCFDEITRLHFSLNSSKTQNTFAQGGKITRRQQTAGTEPDCCENKLCPCLCCSVCQCLTQSETAGAMSWQGRKENKQDPESRRSVWGGWTEAQSVSMLESGQDVRGCQVVGSNDDETERR